MAAMDADETKAKMIELLKVHGNGQCADCGAPDPQWSSANLGTFLCTNCSGIHRNLGVHISRVKSLFLDNWKPDEYQVLVDMGNRKANNIYESVLPEGFVRPLPDDSTLLKEQWIRAKYERKSYTQDNFYEANNKLEGRSGFLVKKGKVVKNWRRRYFKIVGSALLYYKKQSDSLPQGAIFVQETLKKIDTESVDKQPFCFSINTPKREFLISADTVVELYEWIQALRGIQAIYANPSHGNAKAADINIEKISKPFVEGIQQVLGSWKSNGKIFGDCFLAIHIVDWLIYNLKLINRKEAVSVGQRLMEEGCLEPVTNPDIKFEDNFELFKIGTIK